MNPKSLSSAIPEIFLSSLSRQDARKPDADVSSQQPGAQTACKATAEQSTPGKNLAFSFGFRPRLIGYAAFFATVFASMAAAAAVASNDMPLLLGGF